MTTVKRHFESNATAPRAHGIAMAWHVGSMQCALQSALQSTSQFAYPPVNAGVVKTL